MIHFHPSFHRGWTAILCPSASLLICGPPVNLTSAGPLLRACGALLLTVVAALAIACATSAEPPPTVMLALPLVIASGAAYWGAMAFEELCSEASEACVHKLVHLYRGKSPFLSVFSPRPMRSKVLQPLLTSFAFLDPKLG